MCPKCTGVALRVAPPRGGANVLRATSETADALLAQFRTVAVECKASWDAKAEEAPLLFSYADDENLLAPSVRKFFELERTKGPSLVITNIPAQKWYFHTGPISEASIRTFIAGYVAGTL